MDLLTRVSVPWKQGSPGTMIHTVLDRKLSGKAISLPEKPMASQHGLGRAVYGWQAAAKPGLSTFKMTSNQKTFNMKVLGNFEGYNFDVYILFI